MRCSHLDVSYSLILPLALEACCGEAVEEGVSCKVVRLLTLQWMPDIIPVINPAELYFSVSRP